MVDPELVDPTASSLRHRLDVVQQRIADAAQRAGRDATEVILVGVTKTFPLDVVVQGVKAGMTDLGENRAQELSSKAREVGAEVRWHFIGRLQTNKVRLVVGPASLVHSVDSLRLAEAIGRRAIKMGRAQEVLIEVNVSGESSKSGVAPEEAVALATHAARVDGVLVRGLMTIPALPDDPDESRPAYRSLAALGSELQKALPKATHLSMGMTRDFEVAVEEGATIVRVGEAIFGPRPTR
ncbi:MAG: YggS family pyridoxal phosphate-dependent enzyme [Actinomycetota bacterium]|nr:YggS family pyridoxal phosphate-dependent enzyme [Actinomycetota bacterium]